MTIANDHSVLNHADTAANWSTGGTAAPDSPTLNNSASTVPIFIDDGNDAAMNFPLKKDANGYTYTSTIGGPAVDISGGGIVVWWVLYLTDVYAIPINYLALRLSSDTGFTTNYREWKFIDATGGDAQDPELLEGWTPCRIYPDASTADGDNSAGTLTTSSLDSIGIVIVAGSTADGKFGGFEKAIYISEMQMHSSATEGLDEMYSDATNGARPNRLGVVEKAGNFFKFNVNIRLGDASATAITTFTETGKTIFFDNVESSHELGFIFENSATYDNNFVLTDCSIFWTDQASTHEIFTDVTNVDDFKVEGSAFANGGKITLPADAVDRYVRSSKFDNCQAGTFSDGEFTDCTVSNGEAITISGDADLTGSKILTPVVAADTSGLVWNGNFDPNGNLDNMTFSKGTNAHHAIEFGTSTPLTMTLTNIDFSGFNATDALNDSTLHIKRTSGTVTINLVGCTGNISYKSAGATVNLVSGAVTVKVTAKTGTGTAIQNANVIVEASDGTGPFPYQDTVTMSRDAGTTVTVTHTAHGMATGDKIKVKGIVNDEQDNSGVKTITVVNANSYTFTSNGSGTLTYTGTILVTFVALAGLTDVNGEISTSRVYSANQPVTGGARKNSASPYYQEGPISGTISSTGGLDYTAVMVSDE